MKPEPMKKDMTYERAVWEAKEGFRIAGATWPKDQWVFMGSNAQCRHGKVIVHMGTLLVLHTTDGNYVPFDLSDHDREATDWTSFV